MGGDGYEQENASRHKHFMVDCCDGWNSFAPFGVLESNHGTGTGWHGVDDVPDEPPPPKGPELLVDPPPPPPPPPIAAPASAMKKIRPRKAAPELSGARILLSI